MNEPLTHTEILSLVFIANCIFALLLWAVLNGTKNQHTWTMREQFSYWGMVSVLGFFMAAPGLIYLSSAT